MVVSVGEPFAQSLVEVWYWFSSSGKVQQPWSKNIPKKNLLIHFEVQRIDSKPKKIWVVQVFPQLHHVYKSSKMFLLVTATLHRLWFSLTAIHNVSRCDNFILQHDMTWHDMTHFVRQITGMHANSTHRVCMSWDLSVLLDACECPHLMLYANLLTLRATWLETSASERGRAVSSAWNALTRSTEFSACTQGLLMSVWSCMKIQSV